MKDEPRIQSSPSDGNGFLATTRTRAMTELLERAIAKVRELPPEEQDEAAEMLMRFAAQVHQQMELDDETRAAIREGLAQADRGEFASGEEMKALFDRFRG